MKFTRVYIHILTRKEIDDKHFSHKVVFFLGAAPLSWELKNIKRRLQVDFVVVMIFRSIFLARS